MAVDPVSLLTFALGVLGIVLGLALAYGGFWFQGAYLGLFGFLTGGVTAAFIIFTQDVNFLLALVILSVFCVFGTAVSIVFQRPLTALWAGAAGYTATLLIGTETSGIEVLTDLFRTQALPLDLFDPVSILIGAWCAYLGWRLHGVVMILAISAAGSTVFSVGLWGTGLTQAPITAWGGVVFLTSTAVQMEVAIHESRKLFPRM